MLIYMSCATLALAQDIMPWDRGTGIAPDAPPATIPDGQMIYIGPAASDPANPGKEPYYIQLVPSDTHWLDVIFQNRLVSRLMVPDDYTFTYEGMEIHVHVESGSGNIPDTMTIVPPPGYYTIPESVTVEENEQGRIEIHPYAMF